MTPAIAATPSPAKALLTPQDHALMLIDYEPQMVFAVASIDIGLLRNNTALLGGDFRISRSPPVDRTSANAWEDEGVIAQVNGFAKLRIVMAGLWTSVCIVEPALSAIEQGFDVYVVADACGDVSDAAHHMAMHRMIQAGTVPITALQYLLELQHLLELQRDWSRTETYALTTGIAKDLGGAYGVGITYAETMLAAREPEAAAAA